MTKTVASLISRLKPIEVVGDISKEVSGVESDSRKIKGGELFVAVNGVTVDGHKFIPDVVRNGAAAIVCTVLPGELDSDVCYVVVDNSASALGVIASQWYDNPSERLTLVGVTGTNGKTTTATLLYELVRLMGHKAGLLSTVCNYVDSRAVEATQTTPDQITINRLLSEMVDEGCTYAFMEVSSHAADQCRIDGLKFKGGVFTNLTRDHLDYHKTVDNYLRAKKRFFDLLPGDAFALVNIDDKTGKVMLQNTRASKHSYSLREMSDFKGRVIENRLDGTLLEINRCGIEVQFTGLFNAYNLLGVYGAAVLMGLPEDEVRVHLSNLVPVAGRFQTFRSPNGITAIVDYAHTPDALVNVLDTIRQVIGSAGKIITVVGAGGNRDKGKRPIMAREAALRSDRVVLTSDNPRYENPDDILNDMWEGLDDELAVKCVRISDRRSAIVSATMFAQAGDVVLVAGKGHEDYQEVNGVKHHFDDREEVEKIFKTQL